MWEIWAWTIPSILGIGVFAVILFNALTDRRDARDHSADAALEADSSAQELWRRAVVVATERLRTALGLATISVLIATVGVISLTDPASPVAQLVGLWSILAVPSVHLLIGVNMVISRRQST